jgi:hypothetical protein
MAEPPFTMSKYASEVELLRDKCKWLQARLDALMLEYCPEEMSEEQKAEWARNQVAVPDTLPTVHSGVPSDG